jgi:hypothetical protein
MPSDKHQLQQDGGQCPRSAGRATTLDFRALCALIGKIVWVATVICWPVIRPIIVLDCVVQLFKAMYHWNTPGSHAGLVFLLHFLVLGALTYFVATYDPVKR